MEWLTRREITCPLNPPTSIFSEVNKSSGRIFSQLSQSWLIACLLAAAIFALFAPVIGFDFLNYDDNLYVYQNPHVLGGFSTDGLTYAFRTLEGSSWMPVTWISYMLDASVFGASPAGFHLTNLLLHSANVVLLFCLLQRLTKKTWAAVIIAAIFAIHPQRAESVVWIAERKDVLCVFFWLLALLAYARHVENPSRGRFGLVTGIFILAVMSKPMVVSFPLVLLLIDFWPLGRLGGTAAQMRAQFWPLLREKIPLLLICLATAAITLWAQQQTHGILATHVAWHEKLFRILENTSFYIRMFFSPSGMSILYRPEPLNYLALTCLGLALIAFSGLAALRWRSWPWLGVGWFWFLLTLAPVAGFIPIGYTNVADRYSYLPSIGLAVAVFFLAAEIFKNWPRARSGIAVVFAGWILFCALATWADLPRWRNTFSIFESAYRHGAHFIACDQLGSQLYSRQEYQASLAVCSRGLADNPQFASLYNTRGGSYFMLGDLDSALADFNQSIAVNPSFLPAYYSRALVHQRRQEFAQAEADARDYARYGGKLDVSTFISPQK